MTSLWFVFVCVMDFCCLDLRVRLVVSMSIGCFVLQLQAEFNVLLMFVGQDLFSERRFVSATAGVLGDPFCLAAFIQEVCSPRSVFVFICVLNPSPFSSWFRAAFSALLAP